MANVGESDLNEERVRQVLEIEKQAQAIHDAAVAEADQLPIQAAKEAQAIIEEARTDAQAEARRLVADAQTEAQEEGVRIVAQAEEDARRMEALAMNHFDRAVSYVLDQVVSRG